jgi:hypothetical protein
LTYIDVTPVTDPNPESGVVGLQWQYSGLTGRAVLVWNVLLRMPLEDYEELDNDKGLEDEEDETED